MNLWLSFNKAITLWPEREALIDAERRFTYRQFGERVASLVTRLKEFGLSRGSKIAISSPNCLEYMEIYYACAISG
ncbi:MAG: AMP-binding protein, partial [Candidatus Obscuribacterales bacterium]|nr:AMP-binding protein [Candidatus Obscuribacterales bacterium]